MLSISSSRSIDEAVASLKFLSDTNRLRILQSLAHSESCVCDLIDDLDLPQTLVSYHLARLKKHGLVRSRRHAQWVYYSLDEDAWNAFVSPLSGLFVPALLPEAAKFGSNHRCDQLPADPARGACCDDEKIAPLDLPLASVRTISKNDRSTNLEEIDKLADAVLTHLLSRSNAR